MNVWKIWPISEAVRFTFPLETDYKKVENWSNSIEQRKSLSENWEIPMLRRSEPKIHPDIFELSGSNLWFISDRMRKKLVEENALSNLQFLPVDTDCGKYFLLDGIPFVDCLDKENSEFKAMENGQIIHYELLDFQRDKMPDGLTFFSVPELPYDWFVTDLVQEICEDNNFQGLEFDSELNLIWDEYFD